MKVSEETEDLALNHRDCGLACLAQGARGAQLRLVHLPEETKLAHSQCLKQQRRNRFAQRLQMIYEKESA